MVLKLLIFSLLLSPALLLRPSPLKFFGFDRITRSALCDLGCKCAETGQALLLLDCSHQGIQELPSSISFDPSTLNLNFQNNNLQRISLGTFIDTDHIEELDFSENRLHTIDDYALAPFRTLTTLNLSHNKLKTVYPGLLDGLSSLRLLEMGHNEIQKINAEAFHGTPNLQELRLQYNPLFDLSEDLLKQLSSLKKLDLQDTGLVMLPGNIFVPTPELRWLSLASNAFENVPAEALSKSTSLESLNLSDNDFTMLVQGDFQGLSSVSQLYLNNLRMLTHIQKNAFSGLDSLRTLSCSYNPNLIYVDEEAFGNTNSTSNLFRTPPQEQFYLKQNGLRTLKSPLEPESWSSLNFADLGENPWKCDCNLKWMTQLKKETQMSIICDSPAHLKGRPISIINASELECEERWALTTFIIVASTFITLGLMLTGVFTVVCSRTRIGLYIRSKQQFAYAHVDVNKDNVELEWDPFVE